MLINPLSLRAAPPVVEQPSTSLLQWRVLEIAQGARVLAGMLPERMTLRVTGPIMTHRGRRFTTVSGRVYRLKGAPASDVRVRFSIAEQLLLIGCKDARDVTEELWAVLQATAEAPAGHGGPRSDCRRAEDANEVD